MNFHAGISTAAGVLAGCCVHALWRYARSRRSARVATTEDYAESIARLQQQMRTASQRIETMPEWREQVFKIGPDDPRVLAQQKLKKPTVTASH